MSSLSTVEVFSLVLFRNFTLEKVILVLINILRSSNVKCSFMLMMHVFSFLAIFGIIWATDSKHLLTVIKCIQTHISFDFTSWVAFYLAGFLCTLRIDVIIIFPIIDFLFLFKLLLLLSIFILLIWILESPLEKLIILWENHYLGLDLRISVVWILIVGLDAVWSASNQRLNRGGWIWMFVSQLNTTAVGVDTLIINHS